MCWDTLAETLLQDQSGRQETCIDYVHKREPLTTFPDTSVISPFAPSWLSAIGFGAFAFDVSRSLSWIPSSSSQLNSNSTHAISLATRICDRQHQQKWSCHFLVHKSLKTKLKGTSIQKGHPILKSINSILVIKVCF